MPRGLARVVTFQQLLRGGQLGALNPGPQSSPEVYRNPDLVPNCWLLLWKGEPRLSSVSTPIKAQTLLLLLCNGEKLLPGFKRREGEKIKNKKSGATESQTKQSLSIRIELQEGAKNETQHGSKRSNKGKKFLISLGHPHLAFWKAVRENQHCQTYRVLHPKIFWKDLRGF